MMINKLSKQAIIGLFFMQLLIGASDADEVKKNITLAIFPCTDVVMSFKKFHPLITYLEKETGFDIKMVYVFTGCASPLHSDVSVSCYFNDLAAVAFLPPPRSPAKSMREPRFPPLLSH